MSSVELNTYEVEEAFCKMLEPMVRKGVLPVEDCNRYGIDVLRNKADPYQLMFHFITLDMLEVNQVMDLLRLQDEGKDYLDHLMDLLMYQLEEARAVTHNETVH